MGFFLSITFYFFPLAALLVLTVSLAVRIPEGFRPLHITCTVQKTPRKSWRRQYRCPPRTVRLRTLSGVIYGDFCPHRTSPMVNFCTELHHPLAATRILFLQCPRAWTGSANTSVGSFTSCAPTPVTAQCPACCDLSFSKSFPILGDSNPPYKKHLNLFKELQEVSPEWDKIPTPTQERRGLSRQSSISLEVSQAEWYP